MMIFHLKYRPKTFSELDLKDIAKSLRKIVRGKNIPQSFLFCGPKGSGKTSAARILAKSVNCLKSKDGEVCLKCENCLLLDGDKSIDVVEIDAASNRGIDDVRLLKDRAYLLPSRLKRKVFIVDEVHMLTKEAFNALLKLLEEPPGHTIFILCTTDPEKIPDTVLSRLVRIDFRKGSKNELSVCLNRVVKGEKIKVDKVVLEKIADLSEGSFRNAQKMLMELFLEFGQSIEMKDADKFFSMRLGSYTLEDFEKDLLAKETKKILCKLEEMSEVGVDFRVYRARLIEYFQKKLLINFGILAGDDGLNMMSLKEWLSLLINAGEMEKESFLEQLPLQLAVVEFLSKNSTTNYKKVSNFSPKIGLKKSQEIGTKKVNDKRGNFVEEKNKEEQEVQKNSGERDGLEFNELENRWGEVLMAVKPFNHSVEAFLRAAKPRSISGMTVVVEVFYPFHKDKLQEDRNRKVVEMGLNKVFNTSLLFECVLADSKKIPINDLYSVQAKKKTDDITTGEDMYDVAKEIFG
ncbi:DNA polymerase III subunit gamma/tau [Patescibacteria group bacterium]|nr:DNA polymerase III subunit gamma/tau [Patescibacteria group bacterium]